jgi:siroheme synthase
VSDASSAGQRVWRGTLGQLAAGAVVGAVGSGPGTIVVGEVVALTAGATEQFERVYVTGR